MPAKPNPRHRSTRIRLAAIFLATAPCLTARAADWKNPADGLFSTPANWVDNAAPLPSDIAHFAAAATTPYTVSLTDNTTTATLLVDNDLLNLDLAAYTYTPSTPSAVIIGASATNAALTLTGSGTLTTTGNLSAGTVIGGAGTINLPSPASLTVAALYLGGTNSSAAGAGILNQSAGATTVNGTLKLWNTPSSAINLSGGTLKVGLLDLNNNPTLSRLNWTGGTLDIAGSSPTLGFITGTTNGPLPANLTISPGMTLKISNPSNTFTINTSKSGSANAFTIDGGTVTANANGSKVNVGTLAFVTSSVNVKNSGTFSSLAVNLGTAAGVNAAATVESLGQWNANGAFTVGAAGSNASLFLSSGGTLTTTELDVANGTTSGGTAALYVNDPTSKLTSSGPLYVARGNFSTGFMYVDNGGNVSDTDGYIGYNNSAASGTAQLSAGSSWTNSGLLTVGYNGTGSLSILSGASLSDTTAYLGYNAITSSGTVDLYDATSTWTNAGNLFVGGNASVSKGSGTLNLHDGTVTVNGTLKIYKPTSVSTHNIVNLTGGTLRVGTLDTNAAPANFAWTGGTLAITNSPLAISAAGPLGASLTLSPGQTLRLSQPMTVAADATLTLAGGSLDLTATTLTWSYALTSPIDTLRTQLFTHAITSSSLPLNTSLAYSDTGSAVLVKSTPTGDINLDGNLGPDDFAFLDRGYALHSVNAHWSDGDFNYDGLVTPADYLLLDSTYLATHPASPAFLLRRESQFGAQYVSTLLAAVPEPTSALACLFAVLPSLLPRRRI